MAKARASMINGVMLLLLLLSFFTLCADGAVSISSSKQRQEVKRLLKRLNKSPVKTIHSPDGDIVDCIHILDQPAFDNPLLKNHTIRTRPTSHPEGLHTIFQTRPSSILQERLYDDDEGMVASDSQYPITQLWHQNGSCPENTVPIRRVKEEDVLRAGSIQRFGKKEPGSTLPHLYPMHRLTAVAHEYAVARETSSKYHGTKVTINVWNPYVERSSEFSLSQLWLLAGLHKNRNTIEVGWQVYQDIYGDKNTRLFIYWTNDSYGPSGCYNLKCSGFVHLSRKILIGGTILPVSIYNGKQANMTLLVWKDMQTDDWWLQYDKEVVGYWPATIFTEFEKGASRVDWGGEIVDIKIGGHHSKTNMGSGHFSKEGFGKASFFRNIQIIDDKDAMMDANMSSSFISPTDPDCYDIKVDTNATWGAHFFYGGPGKNKHCP